MKPRKSLGRLLAEQSSQPMRREYAGAGVSKVKFLPDQEERADYFVTGSSKTGGGGCNDVLSLWNMADRPREEEGVSGLEKASELKVSANVNDIFVVSTTQLVVGLANGDVNIVDCQLLPRGGDTRRAKIATSQNFPAVHGEAASSMAVCVLHNEIFSGSDTGQIVRISPQEGGHRKSQRPATTIATDLMSVRCMAPMGSSHLLVSGHSTGQVYLWDVRQMSRRDGGGGAPAISRAVAPLNDAITALATHPAQTNVLAFGTYSGSVSFIDVRQPKELFPNLFKVSQESISQIKFHPVYADNCFSSSESGVVHWDASGRGMGEDSQRMMTGEESDVGMENDEEVEGHANIWISSRAWDNIQLKAVVEEDPRLISSFDVSLDALVVCSHAGALAVVDKLDLS